MSIAGFSNNAEAVKCACSFCLYKSVFPCASHAASIFWRTCASSSVCGAKRKSCVFISILRPSHTASIQDFFRQCKRGQVPPEKQIFLQVCFLFYLRILFFKILFPCLNQFGAQLPVKMSVFIFRLLWNAIKNNVPIPLLFRKNKGNR